MLLAQQLPDQVRGDVVLDAFHAGNSNRPFAPAFPR
jgi:hypothetical protein